MRILLAGCGNALHANENNPYVSTLVDEIDAQYKDVEWECKPSAFWSDEAFTFNLVHIQWPHGLITREYTAAMLEERLSLLKRKGIRIVATCHNLEPHYAKSEEVVKAYRVVYSLSDCILHLGNYSRTLLQLKYPSVRHELLLHHAYDKLYPQIPSLKESIRRLHLSPARRYVLCFGNFRADEERRMIIRLSKRLAKDNIRILAPSFYRLPVKKNFRALFTYVMCLKYAYYKLCYPNIYMIRHFVDDAELPYWYGASAVSLIQRVRILNSGSVSLGFYMKNCVVGPDLGNVGPWLRQTGNPVFMPSDEESLYRAVKQGLSMPQQGEKNHRYAMNHLTSGIQADKLYHIYKSLVS
jgi:hypothetical protein